jgi:hypothetical protein
MTCEKEKAFDPEDSTAEGVEEVDGGMVKRKESEELEVGFAKGSKARVVAEKDEPAVTLLVNVVVQEEGAVGAARMVTEAGESRKLCGLEVPPLTETSQVPANGMFRDAEREVAEEASSSWATEPVMVDVKLVPGSVPVASSV